MTTEHHRHTESGTTLTDELIEKLADEAEQGFDADEILGRRGKRGRPSLGSGPSTVESVRLDAELKERLARRAEEVGVAVSEIIREALRHHLDAAPQPLQRAGQPDSCCTRRDVPGSRCRSGVVVFEHVRSGLENVAAPIAGPGVHDRGM